MGTFKKAASTLFALLLFVSITNQTFAEDKGPQGDPADKSLFDRVSEKISEKYSSGDVGDANTHGNAGDEHHATEDARNHEPVHVEAPTPVDTTKPSDNNNN